VSRFIQDKIFTKLRKAYDNNCLSHSILFHLPQQLDLESLLKKTSAMVLQQSSIDNLILTPDVHIVNPENEQTKINEITSVINKLRLTAYNLAKVVIIFEIESLNVFASNALLKTLEEPSNNTYFFLVSYQLSWVIPTILSRVQIIEVLLNENEKIRYLQEQHNLSTDGINKALRISRRDVSIVDKIKKDKGFWLIRRLIIATISGKMDVIQTAEKLSLNYLEAIYWITSLVIDLFYLSSGIKIDFIANFDQEEFLYKYSQNHQSQDLYILYQRLLYLRNLHGNHITINRRLALESILLKLCS
jgi:DNA polymerase-3 subunit delta'